MTSIINSSNANSALINTINASESKYNPSIYSTKRIAPAAATTYVTTSKSSGSVGANQTMVFDLMKYGIAQQMLLVYSKTATANDLTLHAYDFLDVIDRIELLSSSKVIDTLTRYDLLAQFSDLDASQFHIVNNSCIKGRTTAASSQQIVVPLVFGFFKDINTNLNLQFNEPMSVRVRWGSNLLQNSAGTNVALPESEVYLKLRYKAYNESDFSEILTENYNEPELNQMSTGFYMENATTVAFTQAPGAGAVTKSYPLTGPGIKVELKNTDCVNNFYITFKQTTSYASATSANHNPLKIKRVRFTASGQEIFDLKGVELFYSKLCVNGFSILTNELSDINNVCKIQTGYWEYSGGGTQSNTLSLRELNNPIIEIWPDDIALPANDAANPAKTYSYEAVVSEEAVKIYSTTSAVGRVQVSLSN